MHSHVIVNMPFGLYDMSLIINSSTAAVVAVVLLIDEVDDDILVLLMDVNCVLVDLL